MAPTTPIDVEPIGQSSSRDATKQSQDATSTDSGVPGPASESAAAKTPSDTTHTASYHIPHYGNTRAAAKPPSKASGRVGGAVQLIAGGAIALVGIPMLVLPGPGLLAIGGGAVLAVNGAKKLMGR